MMTIMIDSRGIARILSITKYCSKSLRNESGREGDDRVTEAYINTKLKNSVLGPANKQQLSRTEPGRANWEEASQSQHVLSHLQLCFYCCGLAFQDTDPRLEISQTAL